MWDNVYTEILLDRTLVIHFSIHSVVLTYCSSSVAFIRFHLLLFNRRYRKVSDFSSTCSESIDIDKLVMMSLRRMEDRPEDMRGTIDRGRFLLPRHNNVSCMWFVYRVNCTCGIESFSSTWRIKSKDFHFTQFISYVMLSETDTLKFFSSRRRFEPSSNPMGIWEASMALEAFYNTFRAKVNAKDASTF